VFVQSTIDQYGPVEDLNALLAQVPEPKTLVLIDAQDHFFAGSLEILESEIAKLP
jgi:alpha/beta superfamily hydrolase